MFSSPTDLMYGRESRKYDDPSACHNKFFYKATSYIDDLFAKGREDGKEGCPNTPIRILIAMSIQYYFYTRNKKTIYRGLIKHKMQALAHCT